MEESMNCFFRIPFKVMLLTLLAFFLIFPPAYSKDEIRSPSKRIQLVDYLVIVEGRWKQTASSGTNVLGRINSAYVTCNKSSMICEENIAVLANPQDSHPDNFLYVLSTKYKIISWSNDIINAKYEALVADLELRISVRDKFAERSFRETKARGSDTANPNIFGIWVLE
jgi:hypothetical protein